MSSKALFLLLLLPQLGLSFDLLKYHLENLVDRNISACDDFYHHACSQHVDPNEFFMERVSKIFKDVIDKYTPDSGVLSTSPILYGLEQVENLEFKLEDNNYETLARMRCKKELECYEQDQRYYSRKMIEVGIKANLTNVRKGDKNDKKINKYISGTKTMVDQLTVYMNSSFLAYKEGHPLVQRAIVFNKALQARMHIIEFMKSNNTYSDFHEIREITETMMDRMIKNIKESSWLSPDEMSMLTEKVEGIQLYHDFDEIDKNLTSLKKLNHDMNQLYFTNRKSGVEGIDTLFGVRDAFDDLYYGDSPETTSFMDRISENFGYNAFFQSKAKSVTMLAPLMYRPTLCSEIISEPIVTYYVLGHELYHSLFSKSVPHLLELYGHRSQCLAQHYENSCTKFRRGECGSGMQTITEDGPDIESFRLLHGLMKERYGEELTNAISGMDTTLEQAFFYYAASSWCAQDGDRTKYDADNDPHSAKNIRINAAFSLMPEFSRAFGCKADDPMYVEEQNSCYFFGPKSA